MNKYVIHVVVSVQVFTPRPPCSFLMSQSHRAVRCRKLRATAFVATRLSQKQHWVHQRVYARAPFQFQNVACYATSV